MGLLQTDNHQVCEAEWQEFAISLLFRALRIQQFQQVKSALNCDEYLTPINY